MKIHTHISEIQNIPCPVVTVGTFDGVHRGHQQILNRLKEQATNCGGESVLVTFHPHPRIFFSPDDKHLKLINTRQDKISLLNAAGIDHLVLLPFNKQTAAMSFEQFVREILVKGIGTRHLVVGYDHQFGRNREGNFAHLQALGQVYNFQVEQLKPITLNEAPISSTRIRQALLAGDINRANQLLGYEYHMYGRVVYGNQIGKSIGFPTANIDLRDKNKLVPGNGVYAVRIDWNGELFEGMGNIGIRPTIDQDLLTIEVNIFNFHRDIYSDYLTVYFVERTRDEVKFRNLNELRNQLQKDKKTVKEALQKLNPPAPSSLKE